MRRREMQSLLVKSYQQAVRVLPLIMGRKLKLKLRSWRKLRVHQNMESVHVLVRTFLDCRVAPFLQKSGLPKLSKKWLEQMRKLMEENSSYFLANLKSCEFNQFFRR